MYQSDVLVIGSGIAGGITALQLADAGLEVLLVTRSKDPTDSNTYYAQGGIIYKGKSDSPKLLTKDIILAGANLNNEKSAYILAKEGPKLIEDILIKRLNTSFDRDENGQLSLSLEGGHSISRIIHSKDATGKAIEISLINVLKKHPNVKILQNHTAIDLLTMSHHSKDKKKVYLEEECCGAYIFDNETKKVLHAIAKRTVLATGGIGQIFLRTTNPKGARGDGLAMASRARTRIINAEYIQFHPTTFYKEYGPLFLISEAVRGAGGKLVNKNGATFMEKYSPEWKDLATRDIVARSILNEMLTKSLSNVYINIYSYLSKNKIKKLFPNIYRKCLENGVDITQDLIPIVPSAHYFCGGVWTDEWGKTTIRNLYAVGEVACNGLHGANRLASASLLEGLVWGIRAAKDILNNITNLFQFNKRDILPWIDTGIEDPDPALIQQDMNVIKHIMWNYVGLIRSTKRLDRAIRELRNLEIEIEHFYRISRITDSLIGLRNSVQSALIITTAAWKNHNSCGCHYREL
ncbi:MAG: L-aspartate oxidase [Bacteroidetes bacterium]|nr:L-aspartate oxidase [Bacteroidota bacterium]